MHILPIRVHAILDYAVGILLIIAPWVVGFATGGPAQWVPVTLGAAIIVYSLLTAYYGGISTLIPLPTHLGLDVLAGIFLTISPWLFGFENVIIWPHVVVGLAIIIAATLTPSASHVMAGAR